jgi:hypothetical protein
VHGGCASGEMLGGEANGHPAFADGGSGHAGAAGADVPDGEDTGKARLEQEGVAAEPAPGVSIPDAPPERGTGEDEAVAVELDAPREPLGVRRRADQDDEGTRGERSPAAGAGLIDGDALEMPLAVHVGHLVTEQDVDPGVPVDPLPEVCRHSAGNRVLAYDEVDVAAVLGERERRLAGRVAPPTTTASSP